MLVTKRTLLVVEDDPKQSNEFTEYCRDALQGLEHEGLHIEETVKQAHSYSEAKEFLDSKPDIDFMSVDMALRPEEHVEEESAERPAESIEQRRNRKRTAGYEAGGMKLLRDLRKAEKERREAEKERDAKKQILKQTLVVVMTGEYVVSYANEALTKYKAMAFFDKSTTGSDEYMNAVKAAMWYLDAVDWITKLEKRQTQLDNLEVAKKSWRKAQEAAGATGTINFPEDLTRKLESIHSELTHPATKLPLGDWTEQKLKSRIVGHDNWSLVQVTLKGFSEIVSRWASQKGPIFTYVANLLEEACRQFGFQGEEAFIGHIERPGYTSEPRLVMILDTTDVGRVAEMIRWIESSSKTMARAFVPTVKPEASTPELVLKVRTLTYKEKESEFSDLPYLLDTLGQS